MAGVSFTDEQLERALETFKTAAEIKKFLADEYGNEPSTQSLKNRIFHLMQVNQTFYRVEGLDRTAKKRKKHVEYNQRGIFVPAALLAGCGFVQGNRKEGIKGQKFTAAFTEYEITLTPVTD